MVPLRSLFDVTVRLVKEIVLKLRARTALAVTTIVFIIFFAEGYSGMAQPPSSSEHQEVVDVMSTFFAAAHDDDLAKFNSIVAPSHQAFTPSIT
jgi:hypothetical protein